MYGHDENFKNGVVENSCFWFFFSRESFPKIKLLLHLVGDLTVLS